MLIKDADTLSTHPPVSWTRLRGGVRLRGGPREAPGGGALTTWHPHPTPGSGPQGGGIPLQNHLVILADVGR